MGSTESDTTPTDEFSDDTYHGTRGDSGSEASREAAYADLVHGVTNKTQRLVLILAAQAGAHGVTIAELREEKGALHHGRMSSALTKHHIAGRLVALRERRGHCGVYVLPEHVNGREIRLYRAQRHIDPEVIMGAMLAHRQTFPVTMVEGWNCTCGWFSTSMSHKRHVAEKIAQALS